MVQNFYKYILSNSLAAFVLELLLVLMKSLHILAHYMSYFQHLIHCSERAAADTSQLKKLEGILTEAQNLESYLKEKKKELRQTLAVISDKLQH